MGNIEEELREQFFEAFSPATYPISNQILTPVCEKCNDSPDLFLYKIEI